MNGGHGVVKTETATQAIKATPAVVGATIAGLTLNEVVAVLTIVYVALQTMYLLWKWRKEYRENKK